MFWSSLFLYAMLLGSLGTVNTPSSVKGGGSLSLVAQVYCDFDPSGSHAGNDGDQCSLTLRI